MAEINVDEIGHAAVEAERETIVATFGPEIAGQNGAVDRKALGRIVFSDGEALKRLESIVHPRMVSMVEQQIEDMRALASPPRGIVVNAAILIRMGLDRLCDTVLYVHASLVSRLRRARQRDHAGFVSVLKRLAAQRDVAPQFSASNADIQRVENDGSREQLHRKLKSLLSLP